METSHVSVAEILALWGVNLGYMMGVLRKLFSLFARAILAYSNGGCLLVSAILLRVPVQYG